MNFGNSLINLNISVGGFDTKSVQLSSSSKTVLTSGNLMDENSFEQPKKVSSSLFPCIRKLSYQVPVSDTSVEVMLSGVSIDLERSFNTDNSSWFIC